MDTLANGDLNCAVLHLEQVENLKTIRRKWKHRRSRSTSNLLNHSHPAGKASDSDDDGIKDRIDSDDAERSLAKLTLQSSIKVPSSKYFPSTSRTATIVESDSFNEFFGTSNSHSKSSHGRRRRRHRRIVVDDTSNEVAMTDGIMAPPGVPKELLQDQKAKYLLLDESGKRKRNQREKLLNTINPAIAIAVGRNYTDSAAVLQNSPFQAQDFMNDDLMKIASELMDEDMKSDDDSSSSISSREDDGIHPSCDEGREGDDEHSDWVGDEWMDEMDAERRHDLMLRRIRDYGPSREIRAGKRRVYPNKPPVFSIRTSYNEKLSRFLQDPDEVQLTLHPLQREEIDQLSHLASLYSLQINCVKDDQGLNCHILMKTPLTTQMVGKEFKTTPSPIVSESDTKRVKI